MLKKIITAALAVILAILLIVSYAVTHDKDKQSPTISFTSDIYYNEGDDISKLLDGVVATDDVDGDVSANVLVEQMVISQDKTTMLVYYAAKDSANNIAKATRSVVYIPAEIDSSESKYRIMMINNLGVENLATVWSRKLNADGHTVTAIGLSTDDIKANTVIIVPTEGEGESLLQYFPDAEIVVGSREGQINVNSNGAEVFIVLGTNDSQIPA